jgi:hypothetical protein
VMERYGTPLKAEASHPLSTLSPLGWWRLGLWPQFMIML